MSVFHRLICLDRRQCYVRPAGLSVEADAGGAEYQDGTRSAIAVTRTRSAMARLPPVECVLCVGNEREQEHRHEQLLLPCGHSCCRPCLPYIRQRCLARGDQPRCPACQQLFEVVNNRPVPHPQGLSNAACRPDRSSGYRAQGTQPCRQERSYGATQAQVKTGALVQVQTAFTTDGKSKFSLTCTIHGIVRRIDDATDDALIRFDSIDYVCRIGKHNFHNLEVIEEPVNFGEDWDLEFQAACKNWLVRPGKNLACRDTHGVDVGLFRNTRGRYALRIVPDPDVFPLFIAQQASQPFIESECD